MKQKQPKAATLLDWDALIEKASIGMYQTPRGPLMGLVGKVTTKSVQLYAPAWVNQPTNANVIFLPVFPVEEYMLLYQTMLIGENPVPHIVEQGYRGYVQEFIKGSYKMNPVVISAGNNAKEPHSIEDKTEKPPALEKCPACGQLLSNWQAHYPVYADAKIFEDVLEREWAGKLGGRIWICETTVPDIREKMPNYEPPTRPLDS